MAATHKKVRQLFFLATCIALLFAVVGSLNLIHNTLGYLWGKARGGYTVAERVDQFGQSVKQRLEPAFSSAGIAYPPKELALLGFKDTKQLEMYAKDHLNNWHRIKTYPILAASGDLGPKLEEGDEQVPEGIYRLESLNPNSRFHLSLRLSYPNDFDLKMAKVDGRNKLGGDIMIHGNSVSVGCLAMGDAAAEELFIVSALVGKEHVKVIIGPTDFRNPKRVKLVESPAWVESLYSNIRQELKHF